MPTSPAFDLDAFFALPRLGGLSVSPDGSGLLTSLARLDEAGTALESSLWHVDPAGSDPPRRITRWAKGDRAGRFAPDGTVLFVAPGDDDDAPGQLLRLPHRPGEAEVVAAPPAGITAFRVAARSGRLVLGTQLYPGTSAWEEDERLHDERTESKVTARLHEQYPVRYWDRWIGPRERHLFAHGTDGFHHLTAGAGFALETETFDVAPDGDAVALTWACRPEDPRDERSQLVVVRLDGDGAFDERAVLLDEPLSNYHAPAWSPDGRRIAVIRRVQGSPERCDDHTLVVVDVDTGQWRDVLSTFDRWPQAPVWAPDGRSLYVTADDDGHVLPFRVDVEDATLTRLASAGAFSDLVPSPDGGTVYAVRSSVAEAPHLVALDPAATDGEPRRIPDPAEVVASKDRGASRPRQGARSESGHLRHRVERVAAEAPDGTRVPGWLVLPPESDEPVPLAVFIHGGPLGSWNSWHWRWTPHLLAARGWAVLLPDPALSTGYGLDYIQRGWGRWGAEPYTDLMALVEATCEREDVDGQRTAALGGSFGGYMANWIAGHTDRFDAIVTHASLWHLEGFHGVTDSGPHWENEFGDRYREPERYREWSPHRFVDRIKTPMLVIHGERDFRVPISESLALWTDLRRHGVEATFLHFPDENHWVLAPQHARLWHETVMAWLDHHVLGQPWTRPPTI